MLSCNAQIETETVKTYLFPSAAKVDANVAKVWSLNSSDLMDDEVDLVDEDELLDENDLKKPDPASLKGI